MPTALSFRLADGFGFRRRSIGFLEAKDDCEMNAGAVFDALTGKARQTVRTRMDRWKDGFNSPNWYFHGWNLPNYKDCFVFKWDDQQRSQRLYGFLCNPKPVSDPGFRACVLVYHVTKHEEKTEFVHLDRINKLRQDLRVQAAIKVIYPEFGGRDKWTN